jgi:TolA-binding protein
VDPQDPVGSLLKNGKPDEALALFEKRVAADPAFKLPHAEHVLPLAKAAVAAGNLQAAVAALRGFDKKYPGHELIPDVYVFSAKLMADKLGNGEMAKKLLNHVMERYPGHYLAQEAKKTLQAMA